MASTSISRVPSSSGNRKTFSISFWVKRTKTGTSQFVYNARSTNASAIFFTTGDQLYFTVEAGVIQLQTNRVFRDTSAWYHIVYKIDTTQATSTDRAKLYVNGVQETSFATATYPSQNADTRFNENCDHNIGRRLETGQDFFEGLLSHFHQTDGTAYDASAFGQTDANGVWTIKTSPSVTYGTNGFFILKDGNGITDQSGNGNNFSVANGTLTNTEDNPSNVFATYNTLTNMYGSSTLSNGNTTQTQSAVAGNYSFIPSTLGFSSGKWYWEMKCVSGHVDSWYGTGITSNVPTSNGNWLGQNTNDYGLYGYSYGGGLGSSYTGGTRTDQGLGFTAGDIIGCAVDCDNLAIYFSKNGTWMSNSSSIQGVPTSGASKTGSFFNITAPSSTNIGFYFPASCYFDANAAVISMNFGNGYFGTTAVASAGTNASGNGIFEYDVPTGYTALSTKGLNS